MEKVANNKIIFLRLIRKYHFLLIVFSIPSTFSLAQTTLFDLKITANFREADLEDVIMKLSKDYGINFSYSDDVIPLRKKITLNAEGEPLPTFLKMLFENMDVDYKVLNNRIVLKQKPVALSQTIRGKVLDANTRIPITGASIVITNTSPIMGGISDKDGNFAVPNVPVGRHTLTISCVGYVPGNVSNVLLNTGKELFLEVRIAESVTAMDEVIVTGSSDDPHSGNALAVVSARSFSVEETKRYAASFSDPARMVAGLAGVTGADDDTNALVIRGNSPRGLLWRIEGMEMPNPNHFANEGASSGVISILSANVLDNFDFYTGAFPANYGNALSGVFDLSLRNGNVSKREYTFQAGLMGIEAAAEGPFSENHNSSYLINYRYSTLNILDKIGFNLNEIGQYKNYQDLAFKANFPTQKAGIISVYGIGGLSKSDQVVTSKVDQTNADVGIIGINHKKAFEDHTVIQTGLSVSGTRISNFYDSLRVENGILNIQEQYIKTYARASFTYKRKINRFIFLESGAIYSRLFYDFSLISRDSENPAYPLIRNFSEEEKGNAGITQAYGSIRQKFGPRFSAVWGLHFLQFGLTGDYSIEPRVAITYQLNPRQLLSFGAGKHSRIENLQYYLARDHQAGGNEVQVNRNLGFTRSNHYVIGFTNHFGNGINFKTEAYYQHIYNAPVQANASFLYAAINDDSGFITDSLNNTGKGRNQGVELSLEKSFTNNYYFMINSAVYQSKFSVGNEQEYNTVFNGNYNVHLLAGREFTLGDHSQKNVIGLNIRISSAGGRRYIPIDLKRSIEEGREVADLEKAYEVKYPNYFRADCQLTYRKNKPGYSIEWRLDVQNFTNHSNPLYYHYKQSTETIEVKNQMGLLPVLSYRIQF